MKAVFLTAFDGKIHKLLRIPRTWSLKSLVGLSLPLRVGLERKETKFLLV